MLGPKPTKLWGDSASFLVRSTGQPENPCRAMSFEEVNLKGKNRGIIKKCRKEYVPKNSLHIIEKLDTHTYTQNKSSFHDPNRVTEDGRNSW